MHKTPILWLRILNRGNVSLNNHGKYIPCSIPALFFSLFSDLDSTAGEISANASSENAEFD